MRKLYTVICFLLCISLTYCNSNPGAENESDERKTSDETIIASSDKDEMVLFGCMPRSVYHVSTYAGTGAAGATDGQKQNATFNLVQGMAFDKWGNLYIADALNHKIREISPNGKVTTIAGTGNYGSADGPAGSAEFAQPECVAVDKSGNVYVTDFNNKIRKISTSGVVTTFAGSGVYGATDGPGHLASFKYPKNMVFDADGNMFVTDAQGYTIRKITPAGVVSTFAGTGEAGAKDGPAKHATFTEPLGIVIDNLGNLFVSDGNHKIRKITRNGMVSTYAGTGQYGAKDGPASNATFYLPGNLALDTDGNLFVCDGGNYKLRRVSPDGQVTTVAGSGIRGSVNGPGHKAQFDGPTGIGITSAGDILLGDAYNNIIRRISAANSQEADDSTK